jgi:hypothetical protein
MPAAKGSARTTLGPKFVKFFAAELGNIAVTADKSTLLKYGNIKKPTVLRMV